MAEWWSIEVFDGEFPATRWRDTYSSTFIESAISHGATDWTWHVHRWGVVFEAAFDEDAQWEAFCGLPAVRAARCGAGPGERAADLPRARRRRGRGVTAATQARGRRGGDGPSRASRRAAD